MSQENPFPENPYSAPQSSSSASSQVKGGIVSPMVTAQKLNYWQDPLRSQILDVANQQRWLNIHVGVVIVGGVLFAFLGRNPKAGPDTSNLTLMGLLLAVLLIANYAMLFFRIYAMLRALKSYSPIVGVLLLFIPIIGIITLLYYSSKATNFLLQFGIKVGLLGASPRAIIRQLDQAQQAASPAALVPASLPSPLHVAQAVPISPNRPTPPVAPAAGKSSALPMGKPLNSAAPAKAAAPPAATGQLPVARPMPPVQPKAPQRPKS